MKISCDICKRRIKGTSYQALGGVDKQLCAHCATEIETRLAERWNDTPPEPRPVITPDAEPCVECGRGVVVIADARRNRVTRPLTICSAECRRERANDLRRRKHEPRLCAACGEPFVPSRSDAKTCSNRCRQRLHQRRAAAPENVGHVLHSSTEVN